MKMRANGDHSMVQTTKTRVAGFPLHPHPNQRGVHPFPFRQRPTHREPVLAKVRMDFVTHLRPVGRWSWRGRWEGAADRPRPPCPTPPCHGVTLGSLPGHPPPPRGRCTPGHNRCTSGSTSEGKRTQAALRPLAEAGLQRLQPREKTGLRVSRAHVITGEHVDKHTHGQTTRGQTTRKRTLD